MNKVKVVEVKQRLQALSTNQHSSPKSSAPQESPTFLPGTFFQTKFRVEGRFFSPPGNFSGNVSRFFKIPDKRYTFVFSDVFREDEDDLRSAHIVNLIVRTFKRHPSVHEPPVSPGETKTAAPRAQPCLLTRTLTSALFGVGFPQNKLASIDTTEQQQMGTCSKQHQHAWVYFLPIGFRIKLALKDALNPEKGDEIQPLNGQTDGLQIRNFRFYWGKLSTPELTSVWNGPNAGL